MGLTPLQALDRLRQVRPEYADSKLSYAGRLDPMAEGVMLVLVGEANQSRSQYLGLDKEYQVEVLIGVSTDTGDVLGLITDQVKRSVDVAQIESQVVSIVNKFKGRFTQDYPKYSSPVIAGKEGFTKEVEIYRIEAKKVDAISALAVSEVLNAKLGQFIKINPREEFRQSEVLSGWQFWLDSIDGEDKLAVVTVRVQCSSGVYMRVLAERLGVALGYPALALSIVRTKVGETGLDQCVKLQ